MEKNKYDENGCTFVELNQLNKKEWERFYSIRFAEEIHKYFGGGKPSLSEHLNWVEDSKTRNDFRCIAVFSNSKMIGGVGLKNISDLNQNAEFDVFIASDFWGRGFGLTMMKFILNLAFEELNMHRVYGYLLQSNIRALALYIKCGFSIEGVLRENVRKKNLYDSSVLISILKSEFYETNN